MSNNIFDDFPAPLNGMDGFNQWQRVVQSGNFRLYTGQVVNTSPIRHHAHTSQHYDVALFEYDETGKRIMLYEVKVLSPTIGFDGANSAYYTFFENQPVLLLAREGILDEAIIIGSFTTSGDHKKYLGVGHADKPGEVYEDYQGQKEANQGSVFPYRVAKPQGFVRTVAGTNLTSPHDDPSYYYNLGDDPEDNLAKKAASRPMIAGVEIMNEAGYVNHHIGPVSLYSFSQVILLSRNNRENECARLQRHAAFYASMHQKLSTQLKGGTIDTSSTLANTNTNTPQSLHGTASTQDSISGGQGSSQASTSSDWLADMQFGDMFSSLNKQPSKTLSTSSWLSQLTGQPDLGQVFFDLLPPDQQSSLSGMDMDSPGKDSGDFDYLEALPGSYHLEQLAKLAQIYQEAAAACNAGQAALRDANDCSNPCEGQANGNGMVDSTGVTVNSTGNGTVSSGGVFTPEVRAYLDLVAYKEVPDPLGERGYYSNNGVGSSQGYFNQTEAQSGFPSSAGSSYNVGRYQFNRGDWMDAKKANPSIQGYTPKDQDLVAYWKMNYRGVIEPLKRGDIQAAILRGGKEWASMPGNPYGQVQSGYTMEKAIAYYNQRLAYHKGSGNESNNSPPANQSNQSPLSPPLPTPQANCTPATPTSSSTGPVTEGLSPSDTCYGQSNCFGHKRYAQANSSDLMTLPAQYAMRGGIRVHKAIYQPLINLLDKARSQGVSIKVTSGFRSIAEQRPLFNTGVSPAERSKNVAPPGFSEHHTGYAIDLCDPSNCNLDRNMTSRAWTWLKANATGDFVLSFPPGGGQGAAYEPWHWRGKGMPSALGGSVLPTPTGSESCSPPPCNPNCTSAARDVGNMQPQQQQSTGTSSTRANLELDEILKSLNQGKQDNQKVSNIKVTGGGNTWQATSNIPNQRTPTKSTVRIKVNGTDYEIEVTGGSISEVNSKVTEALKKLQAVSTPNPNAPLNISGGAR